MNRDAGEKLISFSVGRGTSPTAAQRERRPRESWRLLLQLLLVLLCVIFPSTSLQSEISRGDQGRQPFPVNLSIYVINVGHLDVETGSFTADFYLKLN